MRRQVKAIGWGMGIAMLALASACATTAKFSGQMDTWLGSDVNVLMTQWGPPSRRFAMPNGNQQYTWLYTGGTVVRANYNEYLNMVTAGSVTYWCNIAITAHQSGQIVAWSARGNACRSR